MVICYPMLFLVSEVASFSSCSLTTERTSMLRIRHLPATVTSAIRRKLPVSKRTLRHLSQIESFYDTNGHTSVSVDSEEEYPGLYTWVRRVRLKRRRGQLDPGLVDRLDELRFCWNAQEAKWNNNFERLESFRALYGHCKVPNNSLEYPGLGIWVRNQRREYRFWTQGKPSTLTTERREALEAIDFTWHRNHSLAWNTRYDELCEFIHSHGHSNVPQSEQEGLGKWCMNQRTLYRRHCAGESTSLTDERIRRLNDVGFAWDVRHSTWNSMLERLRSFHEMNNHTNIPQGDLDTDDLRLWTIRQRHRFNAKLLSPQRREQLAPVAADWSPRRPRTDWAQLFDAIRQRGISPGAPARQHWFDGQERFENTPIKQVWTADDLMELWNQESDDDGGDGDGSVAGLEHKDP